MTSTDNSGRLRMLTYMCPDVPLEVFTLLRDCVEEATGLEVDLMVEDRFNGPRQDRANPFSSDLADIVYVHSSSYLSLRAAQQENMELCPVAPVCTHPLVNQQPVYFSEVIIHAGNKEKYKEVKDLKGCSWAYNDERSLSGNLIVLDFLKKNFSTNASFFGSIVESGSHLNSIKKVLEHSVIGAAVDSTVLAGYLQDHQEHRDKIVSLKSLGPLPIFPALFNSRLSGATKQKIVDKFLSLSGSATWSERLAGLGISGFAQVDSNLYSLEEDVAEYTQGMKMNTAYY
ncbi:uncharacterized protein LOC101855465 [Aplysia californica]|uniref:Uncharacterized protein LOC101855465 n=1 Tax=Aplysia californica TaxID=6500 RepID=A0ABM0KAQ1_APLCA|nr:uncharacterized protein LOC101855465 [Aplysia californica]